jgi:hypothetical protein
MATLLTLAASVYEITNRPDLVAETLSSLRKAIRKFHGADTFKRDLATVQIDITALTPVAPNQYRWNIPLDNFPLYRRFKVVQYPIDKILPASQVPAPLVDWPVGFSPSREYSEVAPDNIFDSYGYERANYYFITGDTVNLKSGWYVDYLNFTYYKWPLIGASGDTLGSWIVNSYPESVVEEAAGAVFKMIGKDEEFNRFQGMFLENLAIVKGSDIGEA